MGTGDYYANYRVHLDGFGLELVQYGVRTLKKEIDMGMFSFFKKNNRSGGLFGYQMAGPRFIEQTSLNSSDYLKGVLINWFQWSETQARQIVDGLSEAGLLSGEAVRSNGVYLTSPDDKEKYHFVKVGRSWEVRRIRPDKPIIKA